MPITDEIKKTFSDPTPLYALAGAGDFAYEKLREVPGKVEALAADRKGTQEKAAARLQDAQARLVEAQAKVAESVTALPTDLKVLQEKAQTFALQQVGRAAEFAVKAVEVYEELAVRGKSVVEGQKESSDSAEAFVGVAAVLVDGDEAAAAEVVEAEVVEAPAVAAEPAPAKKTARTRKSAADAK